MIGIIDRMAKRHAYHTLKSAMHGMTLNTIGRLYEVERQKNEDNHSYEKRILKVASRRAPNFHNATTTEVKV